jgi:hypothetical protein
MGLSADNNPELLTKSNTQKCCIYWTTTIEYLGGNNKLL